MTAPADERIGFEDAYAVHRVPLLRLALLLTGSRDHAEDVVQSVFTTAYPRWKGIDEPRAYLRRAVVNASNEVHRRRAKDRRLPPYPEPVTSIPELDETWAVLLRLPVQQRTVVVLHFYEDQSLADIGRLLGRPAATVRSDLRRALTSLRSELP
jgi:RNA polymerase sigma factor (sigma-70 family)